MYKIMQIFSRWCHRPEMSLSCSLS